MLMTKLIRIEAPYFVAGCEWIKTGDTWKVNQKACAPRRGLFLACRLDEPATKNPPRLAGYCVNRGLLIRTPYHPAPVPAYRSRNLRASRQIRAFHLARMVSFHARPKYFPAWSDRDISASKDFPS